ncbi:MAG: hypothetical protein AB7S26_10060 [Sandaracinaceae bacterium]
MQRASYMLLVIALGACDPASPVADAGAATDGGALADGASPLPPAPVIGGMLGEYEVPLEGPLAAYSRYQITDVHWFLDADRSRMVLEYTLPAEMIGVAHFVDLDGTDGDTALPIMVAGDAGTGVCEQSGSIITCNEMLPGVPVDLAAIDAAVDAGTLPAERAEVSRAFGTDPIGILRFEAP